MKKIIAISLIASMATLSTARAEEVQDLPIADTTQEEMQTTDPQTDERPYSVVGKASSDSAAAARSKQWQNILIAAGAVAIAITALILVHNHAGH